MISLWGLAVTRAEADGGGPFATFLFEKESERSAAILCLPPTLRVFNQWREDATDARSAIASLYDTLSKDA